MKYIILIILGLFLFSFQCIAKNEYYNCGSEKVKISIPLDGVNKVYIESKGEWIEGLGKVTNNRAVITSQKYNNTCKSGRICQIEWVISRVDEFGIDNVVEEYQFAANACKTKINNTCNSYNKGDLISKGLCIRMFKKFKI